MSFDLLGPDDPVVDLNLRINQLLDGHEGLDCVAALSLTLSAVLLLALQRGVKLNQNGHDLLSNLAALTAESLHVRASRRES